MADAPSLISARQLPASTGPPDWEPLTARLLSDSDGSSRGGHPRRVIHEVSPPRMAASRNHWRREFSAAAVAGLRSSRQLPLSPGFVSHDVQVGHLENRQSARWLLTTT